MKVELLHVADCPNHEPAARLLKEILREHGLSAAIAEIPVTDPAHAKAVAFPGSPTIRVDGRDVDATMPAHAYGGLACRTYVVDGKRQGIPSRAMIVETIRAALRATRTREQQS